MSLCPFVCDASGSERPTELMRACQIQENEEREFKDG